MYRYFMKQSRVKRSFLVFCLWGFISLWTLPTQANDTFLLLLQDIHGLVQVQYAGEDVWTKVDGRVELSQGDTIRTFLNSAATLHYPDQSIFTLEESSKLTIKDNSVNSQAQSYRRELKLDSGTLSYKVPPLKEKSSEIKIHSSSTIVGITGTEGVFKSGGGDGLTEHVLLEGTTYNTDRYGQGGVVQKSGNLFIYDQGEVDAFQGDVAVEAQVRLAIQTQAQQTLAAILGRYAAKQQEGFQTQAVAPLIPEAYALLEKRQYADLAVLVTTMEQALTEAKPNQNFEPFKKRFIDLTARIKVQQASGKNVAPIYTLLNQCYGHIDAGQAQAADQILNLMNQRLENLSEAEESIEELYHRLDILLMERQAQGFLVEDSKSLLRQADVYMQQQDWMNAYVVLEKTREQLSLALKALPEGFEDRLTAIEQIVTTKYNEGYQTDEVFLFTQEIRKLIKAQNYVEAQEQMKALELALLDLQRTYAPEWQLKVSQFKADMAAKRLWGYDMGKVDIEYKALISFLNTRDYESLKSVESRLQKTLGQLELPARFQVRWQNFLKLFEFKKSRGFALKQLSTLKGRMDKAIVNQDMKLLDSLLSQAMKALEAIQDEEPPQIQIVSVDEEDSLIKVHGVVQDNVRVEHVFINKNKVMLEETGAFNYVTRTSPYLTQLELSAKDSSGNEAAKVMIPVAAGIEAFEGELKEVHWQAISEGVQVSGKFHPGGKVTVQDQTGYCDYEGAFTFQLTHEDIAKASFLKVYAWNTDETQTAEKILTLEDQWPPTLEINQINYSDAVVPELMLQDVVYKEEGVVIAGQLKVDDLVTIKGRVYDDGQGGLTLKVLDQIVEVSKEGSFVASLSVAANQTVIPIHVQDAAGNEDQIEVPLSGKQRALTVLINHQDVLMDAQGQFAQMLLASRVGHEVVVTINNAQGAEVVRQQLPISIVAKPVVEIVDIQYEQEEGFLMGRSASQATIVDETQLILSDPIQADADGAFTINFKRPVSPLKVSLVATSLEGRTSDVKKVTLDAQADMQAPILYVSHPVYDMDMVTVRGLVEDNLGLAQLLINQEVVNVDQEGRFVWTHSVTSDMTLVEVVAQDCYANETRKKIVLKDDQAPEIIIENIYVESGQLHVVGQALDDQAMREVRLNNVPIMTGQDKRLDFHYKAVLTKDLKRITLSAIDAFGWVTDVQPPPVSIPQDTQAPDMAEGDMYYGSPIVYVTGQVNDPAGIEYVYVQGNPVNVDAEGHFKVKIAIDVGAPQVVMNALRYEQGRVRVSGKVISGTFTPEEILVEAEDLWGNRGELFTRQVAPYVVNEINVFVQGQLAQVSDEGLFDKEVVMEEGRRKIDIHLQDPFDNTAEIAIPLESNAPILEVHDLVYETESEVVVISGSVFDAESGLQALSINGTRVALSGGVFEYKAAISETSLNMVAVDYVGNATSLTRAVEPPDMWPPVMQLTMASSQVIIGDAVTIDILSLDSHTGLPERLGNSPKVMGRLNNKDITFDVTGDGMNFLATLVSETLEPGVMTLTVEAQDEVGNQSQEITGESVLTFVDQDSIAPTFAVEVHPRPLLLGKEGRFKVFSSETLEVPPTLEVILPQETTVSLVLNKVSDLEYEAHGIIPLTSGLGDVVVRLQGGEDLSGNQHKLTEKRFRLEAPTEDVEILLQVDYVDFTEEHLSVRGLTASNALVQLAMHTVRADVLADKAGHFIWEVNLSPEVMIELRGLGEHVGLVLQSKNYAGFESERQWMNLRLPTEAMEATEQDFIFRAPREMKQGQEVSVRVETQVALSDVLVGFIQFADGAREPLLIQEGSDDRHFKILLTIPEVAALGRAMIELHSEDDVARYYFDVVLSSEWSKKLNPDEFYALRVEPDPMIIDQPTRFIVDTQGDIEDVPMIHVLLMDGQRVEVPMGGSGHHFEGEVVFPAGTPEGRVDIVLNQGQLDERHRPGKIEEAFIEADALDVFLRVNPDPILSGESFEVILEVAQELDFIPNLVLKLNDGGKVTVPLNASLPSNRFVANSILDETTAEGLASWVIQDIDGAVIDSFPTKVTAPVVLAEGVDLYVFPTLASPMTMVNIQLRVLGLEADQSVYAHIEFPDGHKEIFTLWVEGEFRKGQFAIPEFSLLGQVIVNIEDEEGHLLGNAFVEIVDGIHDGQGMKEGEGDIMLTPNPPVIGQPLDITVVAPMVIDFRPSMHLVYVDGHVEEIMLLGALPGDTFSAALDVLLSPLKAIEILDDTQTVVERIPLNMLTENVATLSARPHPPVVGQPLDIYVDADIPLSAWPRVRLIYANGSSEERDMQGNLPSKHFELNIAALTQTVNMIELLNPFGVVKDTLTFAVAGPLGLNIALAPMPPQVGQAMTLTVDFDAPAPFIPRLIVDFVDGRQRSYVFSDGLGLRHYEYIVAAADMTQDVVHMALEDDNGLVMDEVYFNVSQDVPMTIDLTVTPNPPQMNAPINIQALFSQRMDVAPKVVVRFDDHTQREYFSSEALPTDTFNFTVPVGDVIRPVMAVEIMDQGTGTIYENMTFDTSPPSFYVYLSEMGSDSLDVSWDDIQAHSYEIMFGAASGDYSDPQSPQVVQGGMVATLTGLTEGATYYVRVQAKDINGGLIAESTEEHIILQAAILSPPTSITVDPNNTNVGSIRLTWNPVSEVDGYRVHYGRSSRSYNESSSPFEVNDANTTQASITGLVTGEPYFLTVTTFTNDNRESPFSDEEVVTFPISNIAGDGVLSTDMPAGLTFNTVSQGTDTEILNFTLTNSANVATNIKTEISALVNILDNSAIIAATQINLSQTAFTLVGSSSTMLSASVSVPATGLSPGNYVGKIILFDDINNNDLKDVGESFVDMSIFIPFGAGGLDIHESDVVYGNYPNNATTSWANFTLENTGGMNYANIKAFVPEVIQLSDMSFAFAATQVDIEVPTIINAAESVTGRIRITIPAGIASGEYGAMLTVYNDANSDTSIDSDEPLATLPVGFNVTSTPGRLAITDVIAQDRGTDGTVDLYWSDPNVNTDEYHIYWATFGQSFNFITPNMMTMYKTAQVTGLTNGTSYKFLVRSFDNGQEDMGNHSVIATPTNIAGGANDNTPPTFAGLERAYATGMSGQVQLEWSAAADASGPITYKIFKGTALGSLTLFDATTSTSYTDSGLTDGIKYYYMVRAQDAFDNREGNNVVENAVPAAAVDKIFIEVASASSTIGNPVWVALKAKDTGGGVVTSFSDSVQVTVSESSTRLRESWLLSMQNRMTGDLAEVDMFQGVGYFTVDSLEPEIITLNTNGIASAGAVAIDFLPGQNGATATAFATQGPARANIGNAASDGALFWVSAVDSNGQVDSNFTGAVNINLTDPGAGSASLVLVEGAGAFGGSAPNYMYTFDAADKGEALFQLKDTEVESINIVINNNVIVGDYTVGFEGVSQYVVDSGASSGISHEALGTRIKFLVYAANTAGDKLKGYNQTATWRKISETIDNESSYVSPSANIQFVDGIAEIFVENSEFETVRFNITEDSNNSVTTGNVDVIFQSTDTSPPEVTEVVAESPYLVRIYFNEDIDSTNALIKSNYDLPGGAGNIHTVCWYEDNVTLNLTSPLTLGGVVSVTVKGDDNGISGVKDKDGNFISGSTVIGGVQVPEVDYQGGALQGDDWFEIQLSQYTVTAGVNTNITVTVRQKNACGYLVGSNRVNAKTNDASATVSTGGSGTIISAPGSVDISMGEIEFTVTVNIASGQNITIDVTSAGISNMTSAVILAP